MSIFKKREEQMKQRDQLLKSEDLSDLDLSTRHPPIDEQIKQDKKLIKRVSKIKIDPFMDA